MQDLLGPVANLRNMELRERHWTAVADLLGRRVDHSPGANTSIATLLDMQVGPDAEGGWRGARASSMWGLCHRTPCFLPRLLGCRIAPAHNAALEQHWAGYHRWCVIACLVRFGPMLQMNIKDEGSYILYPNELQGLLGALSAWGRS